MQEKHKSNWYWWTYL